MKKRIAILLLLTVFSTGVVVSLVIGFYATHSLQSTIEESLTSFHKNLRHRFEAFVIAVNKEERAVAEKMKMDLPKIAEELLAAGPAPEDTPVEKLRGITDRYGYSELYIVGRNGEIINTTFPPDLGFNLTGINESFARKLMGLFGKGEVYPDSMVLSTKTGILNIYGYYGPPGTDYIFEVSMNIREYITNVHGKPYTEYLFHHFFLDAKNEDLPVSDLDFFMLNDLAAWSIVHEGKRLDDQLRQTLLEKTEHREIKGNKLVIYSFFEPPETEGVFNQEYRTKVTLDISNLRDIPTEVGIAIGISLLFILPLAFLLASKAMTRAVIKPIDQLVEGLERISVGDYSKPLQPTGVPEMQRITSVANHMEEEIVKRELALKDSRDNLEKRVIERTAELEQAKEEAEAATRLKDKFISLISHDIRGPLSSAKGLLEAIEEENTAQGGYGGESKELLKNAKNSLGDLLDMTSRLLDISMLQTGNIVPQKRLHHTWAVAEQGIQKVLHSAKIKGQTIVNEVDVKQKILMDHRLISNIMINLLTNAIKFTPRGGTISVYSPDRLSLAVKDTGGGIPPEIRDNLFRHDVKTTATGTEGEKGTGLGLPLCKDIMDAHGGYLTVSTGPEGTEFTLKFPEIPPLVIVADPDRQARAKLKSLLQSHGGIEVIEAETAVEALEAAGRQDPVLIVTELRMPDMEPAEFFRELRDQRKTSGIPVVVFTDSAIPAKGSGESLHPEYFSMELGAEGFLSKSENEEAIKKALSIYLA